MSPRKAILKRTVDDGMEKSVSFPALIHPQYFLMTWLSMLSWSLSRVLEQVNFEKRFIELPQFIPDTSETGTPLPKSPREIVNVYRKKRKLSIGRSRELVISSAAA